MNLGLSFSIGVIPLFGDLFVVFFQANRRNAVLLTRYLEQPEKTERGSKYWIAFVLGGIFTFFIALALFMLVGSFFVARWIYHLITG